MAKLKNAVPKRCRIYYITPGLADYTAEGIGRVLVQKPALDKMMASFVGKPVVNMAHTDKEPDELFQSLKNGDAPEQFADGVISSSGYDQESGWYYVDAMIWDEDTIKNIDDGFSASCAYDVTELNDEGGTFNNVDYAEEVLDGEYVHMAIVPNPRYEQARVIWNSKGEEMAKLFFKNKKTVKNEAPPAPEPEEEEEVIENADGYVEIDGKQVPLEELIKVYQAERAEESTMLNADDEVEVKGKRVKVGDMINAYKNRKSDDTMENEIDGGLEEDAEEVVDEAKQMQNSKARKVKKLINQGEDVKPNIKTSADRIAAGRARYGSPVKQGGNA
jgi:hypothetical protein